jgi:hypothetical protein
VSVSVSVVRGGCQCQLPVVSRIRHFEFLAFIGGVIFILCLYELFPPDPVGWPSGNCYRRRTWNRA